MKNIIVILFFYIFSSFITLKNDVYICKSKGATKYHYYENCRGLNACKHTIEKISLKQANAIGLTLCGWED